MSVDLYKNSPKILSFLKFPVFRGQKQTAEHLSRRYMNLLSFKRYACLPIALRNASSV